MAKLKALYDEDFVRWTKEQAAALRRAKNLPPAGTVGSNLPLDWENLAEEIESLGKSERRVTFADYPGPTASPEAPSLSCSGAARRLASDDRRSSDGNRRSLRG
jgi:Domain of unknown function DUF29